MNFQEELKKLHQQAKQESQIRAEREKQAQMAQRQAQAESFAQLMNDVQPLKNSHRYAPPSDLSPIKKRPKDEEHEKENYFYVGEGQFLAIPPSFSKNGQGANDIKRLQTGHYEVVADVDLHGYTQEKAQEILNEFIEFVQKRGVCGEIIHGSGLGSMGYQPKLKSLVRRWLMMHPDVLAYAEPKNNDGAVLILLKRKRKIHHDEF